MSANGGRPRIYPEGTTATETKARSRSALRAKSIELPGETLDALDAIRAVTEERGKATVVRRLVEAEAERLAVGKG